MHLIYSTYHLSDIPLIKIYTNTYARVCVYIYVFMCVCVYIYTHVHIIHTHTHIYMCVYIYIYIFHLFDIQHYHLFPVFPKRNHLHNLQFSSLICGRVQCTLSDRKVVLKVYLKTKVFKHRHY